MPRTKIGVFVVVFFGVFVVVVVVVVVVWFCCCCCCFFFLIFFFFFFSLSRFFAQLVYNLTRHADTRSSSLDAGVI